MTSPAASPGDEAALAAALLAPDRPVPGSIADPRRFAVYRNNVVVGLIDAIAATFPAVLALVGTDFFRAAVREFVLEHPPTSPILIEYGAAFPDWIGAFPPSAGVPYLADVARLEWAWNRAYNAADAQPLDGAALSDVAPERLVTARVALHPSFALISSRYPALSLWAQATRRVPHTDLDLDEGENGLIVRPHDMVDVRALSPAMFAFLSALQAGATIGAAAEGLNGDQAEVAECLSGLFQLGLAVGVSMQETGAEPENEHEKSAGQWRC